MRIPRESLRFTFEPCREEVAFRFRDGSVARSLSELRARLEHVDNGTLAHHRTHFAAWVRDILQDAPLAARLEGFADSDMPLASFREIACDLVDRRLDALTESSLA